MSRCLQGSDYRVWIMLNLRLWKLLSWVLLLVVVFQPGSAFVGLPMTTSQHERFAIRRRNANVMTTFLFSEPQEQKQQPSTPSALQEEAERLLARAREIRSQIAIDKLAIPTKSSELSSNSVAPSSTSPWLCVSDDPGVDYRLYVDIGREAGSWMEPRWGASGRRIEFSLHVRFVDKPALSADTASNNNIELGGKQQQQKVLQTAEYARLRSGFDRMKCDGGAYTKESASTSSSPLRPSTIRFMVKVEGTNDYGDVTIPAGYLCFSLPCFANNVALLSSKEGPVTIRQMGWNTGWWREESRIVGTFRAIPLDKARQRDGF